MMFSNPLPVPDFPSDIPTLETETLSLAALISNEPTDAADLSSAYCKSSMFLLNLSDHEDGLALMHEVNPAFHKTMPRAFHTGSFAIRDCTRLRTWKSTFAPPHRATITRPDPPDQVRAADGEKEQARAFSVRNKWIKVNFEVRSIIY